MLLCLWVLLINGAPLYYFDSISYLEQGSSILSSLLGSAAGGGATGGIDSGGAAAAGDAAGAVKDNHVSGNRSATYAVLFAGVWRVAGPWAPALLNFAAVLVAAALVARVMSRTLPDPKCTVTLVALPLAAAALTSLPFYIAYLMPDIFAGLALLSIGLLVGFSRQMRPGEFAVAFLLIAAGAISHRSTLVIVALLVPVAAIASMMVSGRKWWIPTGVIALAALLGVVELKGYETAADKVFEKHTVYSPFLTARMIADGPGYSYLQAHCPDPEIDTCKLAEALSRSDDPWRLTASHILFERSEQLGSFKHLTPDDQRLVAAEQREFVLDVFAEYPAEVILAMLGNTFEQAYHFGVQMTVPSDRIKARIDRSTVAEITEFGRLTNDRSWLGPIHSLHTAIYALSLAVIALAFAVPGALDRRHRVFVLMILIAILANAFVCGAVSQPSNRYGARVSWLLPYIATMMSVFSARALASRRTSTAFRKGE